MKCPMGVWCVRLYGTPVTYVSYLACGRWAAGILLETCSSMP